MFDTKPYEDRMNAALDRFQAELTKVRTGRAHPDMLSSVVVEAYGAPMPLNQVANVTTPEAQLLQISPFDPSNVKAISDAIRLSNLGFNPSDDGRIIRVPIPALTEDRRREMVKMLGDKVEDCRIAMRTIRQDAFKDAKRLKDNTELSEDDVQAIE
ncbi:MAG: ribosome recycling factor [Candidatus Saccharimonadales bacterium]